MPFVVTFALVPAVRLLGFESPLVVAVLLAALYAAAVGVFDRDILRQARAIAAARRSSA